MAPASSRRNSPGIRRGGRQARNFTHLLRPSVWHVVHQTLDDLQVHSVLSHVPRRRQKTTRHRRRDRRRRWSDDTVEGAGVMGPDSERGSRRSEYGRPRSIRYQRRMSVVMQF